MPAPEPQHFRIAIGQVVVLGITSQVPPDANVSNDIMRFRLRDRRGLLLIEKVTDGGVTCTDGAAGIWEVEIVENDTFGRDETDPATPEDLAPGLYEWAFWNTDEGEAHPKAYGTCELYRTAETG